MIAFGSAIAGGPLAARAAEDAGREALAALGAAKPALAIAFASATYPDLDVVPAVLSRLFGDIPIVGGTSGGCLVGPRGILASGVSVVVLGGDGIEAVATSGAIASPDLLEVVPRARELASKADEAAKRGLVELTCLAFAPTILDGNAFAAALRKGAGARAQLAGALTGDDLTFDRTRVFGGGAVHKDRFVLAGLLTQRPLGVAARHGCRPVGPARELTRGDGAWLLELDHRPAVEAWLADASAAGARPPEGRGKEVALYLANHFPLGLVDPPSLEPVVRAPFEIRSDGAVRLGASVPEGTKARVVTARRADLLAASRDAARAAMEAAGGKLAGALVLACSGRLAALGESFADEPASIANEMRAPIAGSCVFGEIARTRRDVEAFHNTTVVVVAVPTR